MNIDWKTIARKLFEYFANTIFAFSFMFVGALVMAVYLNETLFYITRFELSAEQIRQVAALLLVFILPVQWAWHFILFVDDLSAYHLSKKNRKKDVENPLPICRDPHLQRSEPTE